MSKDFRGAKILQDAYLSALVISKTTFPNFTTFSVHIICGHDSVIVWRQCNTLCTSGFVDDVTFDHNRGLQAKAMPVGRVVKVSHQGQGELCCLRLSYLFIYLLLVLHQTWSQIRYDYDAAIWRSYKLMSSYDLYVNSYSRRLARLSEENRRLRFW